MAEITVRLADLRTQRNLSQQQVAERAGVRRATISDLERGKSRGIEFDTLARLCEALGAQPSEILRLISKSTARSLGQILSEVNCG